MHHTNTIKRWGILVGLIFGLAQAGQGQPIKSGVRAAFNTAKITQGMAVGPAVEKTFMRNFSAFVPADISNPVTKTALTQAVAKHVPFHVENKVLNVHAKQSPDLIPMQQLRGVFLARPTGETVKKNFFSGFFIKTKDNEKYGVIAAHTLADHVGDPSLQRLFTADIYVNGRFVPVQGEIVQVSAPGGLDLALVKFPSKVERYLTPFELSEEELAVGDEFETLGFGGQFLLHLDRWLLSKNSLYLRAGIELSHFQRRGLCGALLFDKEGKVIGVHTGSTYGGFREPTYVGHATKARFINTLVEAHHNGGKATVPFELNGQKIVDLDINESISHVELLDRKGNLVWERAVDSKFPYRQTEQIIRERTPRYINLKIREFNWDGDYMMARTKNKFGYIDYRYDFLTGQLYTDVKE